MWPTATAPSGFLLCNGAAVSRTTYAALFAIVGTIFGAGDGSTTFLLPNYTDRMPIGAGSLYVANSLGGSKDAVVVSHTHTATVSTIGDHDHATSANGNTNGYAYGGDTYNVARGTIDGGPYTGMRTGAGGTHTHTVTNASEGSSGTNANLPPYLGIFFIIKT